MQLLMDIEKQNLRTFDGADLFDVGDMVEVHVWITEGDKRRIQVFSGLVTRISNGRGITGTFTVRRLVSGLGVERIFPFHSPSIEKVAITRYGKARRAKLYYLRDRVGKEALKVKELMGGRRKRHEDMSEKKSRVRKRGKKARQAKRKEAGVDPNARKVSKRKAKKKRKKSKKSSD